MGIGVKYDDGSGPMRPLSSYKGMVSPWDTSNHGLFGTNPAQRRVGKAASFQHGVRKSLMDKMRERREEKKILDESDPRKDGKVIGVSSAPHPLEADDSSRSANDHSPWGRAVMTGLNFEREAPTGRIIVWGYLRTERFTGEGRCFETTGETKVPVFSFFEQKDLKDNGVFQLRSSESGTVVGTGAYYKAREFISVPETVLGDISEFTGYIILRVQISSSGGTNASVITASTVAAPSDSSCDYPLYHLTDGVVDADYRGAPHVQLYE